MRAGATNSETPRSCVGPAQRPSVLERGERYQPSAASLLASEDRGGRATVGPCVVSMVEAYGNTSEASGLRPGQPTEMCSDVPSQVTSVTTMTAAAIAIVRRRGIRSVILSVRTG